MGKKLCIHGHFYQPPREDPWFGKIFLEGSAAPMRHWNERITRESYAPLAWARRLDGQGRIAELMNCYEWVSFNVGPTLMHWLERQEPRLLERILEADAKSLARWGHGNAIAQVFHHIILPLASELDKEVEIEWALADFRRRFGRESEGLWLSECAADIPTLEAVAARGIKFVVLSPHQARLVRDGKEERAVNAASLDYGQPYKIMLPSGKSVAAFFYEADLAQSVAFEGLLSDGEKFWQKIRGCAEAMPGEDSILTLATDGETYGHHFTFGEMALAYVLAQGYAGRDGLELTNFGAYLAARAPTLEVVLHEPSSWSCAHGVERWRSNCGCSTGGHAGWNQEWRAPLREAMDFVKKQADEHYFGLGGKLFNDPCAALMDYGRVLADKAQAASFLQKHLKESGREVEAWELLRMQEMILAGHASCAWFFDDISRIEPVNAMRFALVTAEIIQATGGPDIEPKLKDILQKAASNLGEEGSGKDVFERRVLPSRQDGASLILASCLLAFAQGRLPETGREAVMAYPNIEVRLTVDEYGAGGSAAGRAVISSTAAADGAHYVWSGRLPRRGEGGFVNLADAELEARPEGKDGPLTRRKGAGLARYLLEFIAVTALETLLKEQSWPRLAVSGRALSVLRPYEEAQSSENMVQRWSQFAVYIPLAVYSWPLDEAALGQTALLLKQILISPASQSQARDILEAAILDELAGKKRGDAEMAAGIERVKRVFERMDWWGLQNALWHDGAVMQDYTETARSLFFRI